MDQDEKQRQIHLVEIDRLIEIERFAVRSEKDHALSTLKALQFSNAGAVVALLTFYGNLTAHKDSTGGLGFLWWALAAWGVGTVFAVSASGLAYMSYQTFASGWWLEFRNGEVVTKESPSVSARHYKRWSHVSIALGALSLLMFAIGVAFALLAFHT